MLPHPTAVNLPGDSFTVDLSNGRAVDVPYSVSPKLSAATPEQRAAVRLSPSRLHWDQIDEHLRIAGLLRDFG